MRVVVNGVGYNLEWGGQGEPLLVLHGFTGNGAGWKKYLAGFERDYFWVVVDFLGHGKSDAPEDAGRYEMVQTVADLVGILDGLKIGRANVLGYSMGARVGLHLAHTDPKRVSRLVLESGSPGLATEQERTQRVASDAALAERIEREGVETFVEYWTNIPLFATQSDKVRAELKMQRLENTARGLANSLRGLSVGVQEPLWDKLGEIETPTLLVTGELDTKFTAIGQEMAKAMPHARLQIVRGAGHTVHLEQPSEFERVVLQFLKEHGD